MNTPNNKTLILIDGHVHFHDCFDLPRFLSSAYTNFRDVAEQQGVPNHFTGVLMLTETARAGWFERLSALADGELTTESTTKGDWTFRRTSESSSLLAERGQHECLFLIAGRQIVTAENLEVHALCTARSFPDGDSIIQVINDVRNSGALAAIPWGVGKWLGRRGRILRKLIKNVSGNGIFLGDIGGRPVLWPRPSLFRLADRRGIRILSGTDPLPLKSEALRPASFGFSMSGRISFERPAEDIKQLLEWPKTHIRYYGRLESPYRFLRNQLLIRLR